MAGPKRQLQHYSHEEHSKCVLQEAEPALKRLRITEPDVQLHTGLQPDQQQQQHQQHQDATHQQHHHHLQQQQHPTMQELPVCDNPHQQPGYPFNSLLKELHMERLQRLQSLGGMQQALGTPS